MGINIDEAFKKQNKKKREIKKEKWLCKPCGDILGLKYDYQIWGCPSRPCQHCKKFESIILKFVKSYGEHNERSSPTTQSSFF